MFEGRARSEYQKLVVKEQKKAQKDKFTGRMLDDYNNYLFPSTEWNNNERSSEVEDFLESLFGKRVANLGDLLMELFVKKGSRVSWVDMGGGRALAMRQTALTKSLREKVSMTNVDLFDYDLKGLTKRELMWLEKSYPGLVNSETKPTTIRSNMEDVRLVQKADLITSVEAIQYLNDPLAAICNWYNQLEDEGLLIIATEHKWSDWIRFKDTILDSDPSPIIPFLAELNNNNILFATTKDTYIVKSGNNLRKNGQFTNIVIQKRPGTVLQRNASVTDVWINPYKFKAAYYTVSDKPVEVKNEDERFPLSMHYYESLTRALVGGKY